MSCLSSLCVAPHLAPRNVSLEAPCPTLMSVEWLPQQLRAPANETSYVVFYERTGRQDTAQNLSIPYSEGPRVSVSQVVVVAALHQLLYCIVSYRIILYHCIIVSYRIVVCFCVYCRQILVVWSQPRSTV